MSGLKSGPDDEVEPWDRAHVWTRTAVRVSAAVGRQSRWWVGPWVAGHMSTVVILALSHAPDVAYVVATTAMCLALCAGVCRE
jgi:hypothetical protein